MEKSPLNLCMYDFDKEDNKEGIIQQLQQNANQFHTFISSESTAWTHVTNLEGVEISKFVDPASPVIHMFRGQASVQVSAQDFYNCVTGVKYVDLFDPILREAKVLKKYMKGKEIGDEEVELYYLRYKIFPPVIADRDFVLIEWRR